MTLTRESVEGGPFELSGGALCLDFANTWGNHQDPGSDGMRAYGDLVAFARQTGILDAATAADFVARAADTPQTTADALARALALRGSLYRVFSARAGGNALPPGDVERLNRAVGDALSHRRLRSHGDDVRWGWVGIDATSPDSLLWPVVESAASLLTSDDVARVRECNAEDCNWLFIDRSRGRTRRWCSMRSCGNRAKARRHYRRKKDV